MKVQKIFETSYGNSQHYLNEAGQAYFKAQQHVGAQSTVWMLPHWTPHFSKNDDILDFGCGDGTLLSLLPGRRKVGVEINPTAQSELLSKKLLVYTSLEEINEKGLTFSRVISSHALEHVPNPYGALIAMRKLLVPEGKLILLLPLDDWRTKHQRLFDPNDTNHHLYTWTPQTLGNLLMEAGFQCDDLQIITDCMPYKLLPFTLHLPLFIRSILGFFFGVILRRRQLMAFASLPRPISNS